MKRATEYEKLFEPEYGELSGDIQVFKDFSGRIDASNRDKANAARVEFIRGLHNNEPFDTGLKVTDIPYKREEYKGAIRVYRPETDEVLPAFVYIHGGGFNWLCIDAYDYECASFAKSGNCVVFSMDYRMAPEFRFPTAPEDCYAALLHIQKEGARFGADTSRIGIAGDSAGGNLAAALCLMSRDRSGPKISLQVLCYPGLDMDADPGEGSYARYGKGYYLDIDPSHSLGELYLKSQEQRFDPYASPLLAENLRELPEALIICGGCDILLDGSLRYAKRLKDAGVPVEFRLFKGMPHGFIQMTTKSGRESIDLICKKIRETLGK